jgi:hypothetical protein
MSTSPYNYNGASSSSDWLQFLQGLNSGNGSPFKDYLSNVPQWMAEQFDQQPTMGYQAFAAMNGQGKSQGYKNYLTNQYKDYYGQYLNMAAQDPTYWWIDYLSNLNPQADYNLKASPTQRGENPSETYGMAPTMRMVW